MSTAVSTCCCGTIGAPATVRLCEDHHKYHRGDKELVSVSKVIRSCWPVKKSFEGAPPEVLEHARERGIRVDRYFSEYLRSGRVRVLTGEWEEVVIGLRQLIEWWRFQNITDGKPQVILADDDVAGTADVITDGGTALDVKCVSALDPSYELQIGAYADLHGGITNGYLVQCKIDAKNMSARISTVSVDIKQAREDWRQLRAVYFMAQRRTA